MNGSVSVDETYVGGTEKAKQAKASCTRVAVRSARSQLLGVRGEVGEIRTVPMRDTRAEILKQFVSNHASARATIAADKHGGYIGFATEGFTDIRPHFTKAALDSHHGFGGMAGRHVRACTDPLPHSEPVGRRRVAA